MKKLLLILAFVFACSLPVQAEDDSHMMAVKGLVKAMKIEEQMQNAMNQMIEMQNAQMSQLGMPGESAGLQEAMMNILREEMAWVNVKDEYIQLYKDTFTEEEAKGLTDFFMSDLGQVFLNKNQILMQKGMEIGQEHAQNAMPKMMKLMQNEFMKRQAAEGEGAMEADDQ